MSRQFGRVAQLIVGPDSGQGSLDVSALRITFSIQNATVASPKTATFRIYNLKPETAQRFNNEFTRVQFSAGYEDPGPQQLFVGEIAIVRQSRRDVDTYVEILCQDGDKAYNYGTVSDSLAAGWTPDDVYASLLKALQPYGITAGNKPTFSTEAGQRGYVLYGMVHAYLGTLAAAQNCDWYIEDGKLNFVPKKDTLPGAIVVLTSATGLLGVPEQTVDGISATCLLNPAIKAGGKVQIDNASIASAQLNASAYLGTDVPFFAGTDKDGFYKSLCVTHSGDTRGDDWTTNLICIAVDGTAPVGGPTLEAVPDGN